MPSPFKRGAQMRPFSRVSCIIQSDSKALIYDQYEDMKWLSAEEMDDWIKQEEIEYNRYKENCRISQEEENHKQETDRIDDEIALQMHCVKKIEFQIKCKQRDNEEALKKRKRDQEIAEQKILHVHVVDIRAKNFEIQEIKEKMGKNYTILENMLKAKMERRKRKH